MVWCLCRIHVFYARATPSPIPLPPLHPARRHARLFDFHVCVCVCVCVWLLQTPNGSYSW